MELIDGMHVNTLVKMVFGAIESAVRQGNNQLLHTRLSEIKSRFVTYATAYHHARLASLPDPMEGTEIPDGHRGVGGIEPGPGSRVEGYNLGG
jgi:hypothetical protein